ncbi:MAG: T9SS type A sorting domain-containing protein [Bacteroidia bacterium]
MSNPTSGSLTLEMELDREDVRVQVLAVTGKVLFETTTSQVERLRQPIDLGDVAPGVYMLNVTTSRGTHLSVFWLTN